MHLHILVNKPTVYACLWLLLLLTTTNNNDNNETIISRATANNSRNKLARQWPWGYCTDLYLEKLTKRSVVAVAVWIHIYLDRRRGWHTRLTGHCHLLTGGLCMCLHANDNHVYYKIFHRKYYTTNNTLMYTNTIIMRYNDIYNTFLHCVI